MSELVEVRKKEKNIDISKLLNIDILVIKGNGYYLSKEVAIDVALFMAQEGLLHDEMSYTDKQHHILDVAIDLGVDKEEVSFDWLEDLLRLGWIEMDAHTAYAKWFESIGDAALAYVLDGEFFDVAIQNNDNKTYIARNKDHALKIGRSKKPDSRIKHQSLHDGILFIFNYDIEQSLLDIFEMFQVDGKQEEWYSINDNMLLYIINQCALSSKDESVKSDLIAFANALRLTKAA
jgi:hypothetical protein